MRKIWILRGEGIECEKESFRIFTHPGFEARVDYISVHEVLEKNYNPKNPGDWMIIPGGFSFADHFGSGRLLGFELRQAGFFEKMLQGEINLLGICNGFQMLCEANLFGKSTRLKKNLGFHKVTGPERSVGFVDRWVSLKGAGPLEGEEFFLPIRHGEGRLVFDSLPEDVSPLLHYKDEAFDNGSQDSVASLICQKGKSRIVGMMPHPEVALRQIDRPDKSGVESMPRFRPQTRKWDGDGVKLLMRLLA